MQIELLTSHKFSRRAFLSSTAAATLLTLSGCRLTKPTETVIEPAQPLKPTATPEIISALQLELEKRYQLIFLSPQKNDQLKLVDYIDPNPDPKKPKLVKTWDTARLQIFDEVLPIIPEGFYNPKVDRFNDSWPLVFALMSSTESSKDFPIAGETRTNSPTYPIIVITEAGFKTDPISRPLSRSTIVHEGTHKALKNFRNAYERFFHQPTGMSNENDLDRVYKSVIDPSLRSNHPTFKSSTAYGARNQEEHTAVAAEHYFLGEEAFIRGLEQLKVPAEFAAMTAYGYFGYARFLGAEQAAIFYRTLKNDLFENREYKYQKLI